LDILAVIKGTGLPLTRKKLLRRLKERVLDMALAPL